MNKKILAIESSCDDTAVAIYDTERHVVICNLVRSQIELHNQYGGIVPELASRDHLKYIFPLIKEALHHAYNYDNATNQSNLIIDKKLVNQSLSIDKKLLLEYAKNAIGHIACTNGPGLIGSLLIGASAANMLACILDKAVILVDHLEGHLLSPFIVNHSRKIEQYFPMIELLVSGGHTQIFLIKSLGVYNLIGSTEDDAAGEAFDKIANMLGLEYPGGPKISQLSNMGSYVYRLPRPMINNDNCNMSFSGLKSATSRLIQSIKQSNLASKQDENLTNQQKQDIARSVEEAITDILVYKTIKAANLHRVKFISISGGVSANLMLRDKFTQIAQKNNFCFIQPNIEFSTDNAAMIAFAASYKSAPIEKCFEFTVYPNCK